MALLSSCVIVMSEWICGGASGTLVGVAEFCPVSIGFNATLVVTDVQTPCLGPP